MKMTVYVPDDLWDEVRRASPAVKASELVQAGLRKLIEGRVAPDFARERPEADPKELQQIRKRLLAEARESYEFGYREGMKRAKYLEWWLIERLASFKWDLARWSRIQVDQDDIAVPIDVLYGFEELALEDTSVGLGFADALRDVWDAVLQSSGEDAKPQGDLVRLDPRRNRGKSGR